MDGVGVCADAIAAGGADSAAADGGGAATAGAFRGGGAFGSSREGGFDVVGGEVADLQGAEFVGEDPDRPPVPGEA